MPRSISRPAVRATRKPMLISTGAASSALAVPDRTIRRWVLDHSLGQLVANRRMLTPADVRALRTIRDQH